MKRKPVVNLRAEGAPQLLAVTVQEALKNGPRGIRARRLAEEAFRPGTADTDAPAGGLRNAAASAMAAFHSQPSHPASHV